MIVGAKIRKDTLQALEDWKAGKPVRSLELGHVHETTENPGASPRVNIDRHICQDQERAHAYCFHIIEFYKDQERAPESYDEFSAQCDMLEEVFRTENAGLTQEELIGAESLAWKALLVGWKRALDGHKESDYIEVSKP